MVKLRGCQISQEVLDSWVDLLVLHTAPFFVSEALLNRLPSSYSTNEDLSPRELAWVMDVIDIWAEEGLSLSWFGR